MFAPAAIPQNNTANIKSKPSNVKNLNKTTIESSYKNYLSAKIKSISPFGTLIVKFSEPLKPIKATNYSIIFNSTNINVVLKPSFGLNDKADKRIHMWEVINVTKMNEMTIQVNFTDPSLISPRIVRRY